MRVLHIITHTPFDNPRFKFLLHDGWQARTARELAKREPAFSVESWMPAFVPKTYSFKRDGIIYRVFPAQKRLDGLGATTSRSLLSLLSEERGDTIFHVHGDRAMLAYSILSTGSNKKIVQHHGSFGFSVLTPLEMIAFRKIKKFYANSRLKQRYLKRIGLGEDKVRIQPVGVDFDFFRPMGRDKSKLHLGLPSNGKMLLYVGRFDKSKGLDVVINAYIALRKKHDVFLVAVGGADSDPFFLKLRSVGAQIFGRVPHVEMPYFYSAADVMCYYWERLYGGVIASVEEALACDTPVVSNTLVDFMNKDEIPRVGLIPKSSEDMAKRIQKILEGRHEFTCRKTAEKYYAWEKIINLTVRDYKGDC